MGVPLLGCFSIMKFRITIKKKKKKKKKKNFYDFMQNKNWLGASCLPRRIWLDSKSDLPRMDATLLGCFSIFRFEITKNS